VSGAGRVLATALFCVVGVVTTRAVSSGQFDTSSWLSEVEAVRPLIVMVEGRSPGSGIVIGRGPNHVYVATAAHVVKGTDTVPVALFGESQPRPARVVRRDASKEDIALLAVDARGFAGGDVDWERLGSAAAAVTGDPRAFALGRRPGTDQRWSFSDEPHRLYGLQTETERIHFQPQAGGSFSVGPGYSGGGLFDTCLQLIGMVLGVLGHGEAVDISRVLRLVEPWVSPDPYVRLLRPAAPCDRPPPRPSDFLIQQPLSAAVRLGLDGRHPVLVSYMRRVGPTLHQAANSRDPAVVFDSPNPFGWFRPLATESPLFPQADEGESDLHAIVRGLRLHVNCFTRARFKKVLADDFRFIPNGDVGLRIPLNVAPRTQGGSVAQVSLTVDAHRDIVWLHATAAPGDRASHVHMPPPRSLVSLLGGHCLLELRLDIAVQVSSDAAARIMDVLRAAQLHVGLRLTPRIDVLPLKNVAVFDRGTAVRFTAQIDRRLP
jgi:hypothetical protein